MKLKGSIKERPKDFYGVSNQVIITVRYKLRRHSSTTLFHLSPHQNKNYYRRTEKKNKKKKILHFLNGKKNEWEKSTAAACRNPQNFFFLQFKKPIENSAWFQLLVVPIRTNIWRTSLFYVKIFRGANPIFSVFFYVTLKIWRMIGWPVKSNLTSMVSILILCFSFLFKFIIGKNVEWI